MISIIIPCLNNIELTRRCWESIYRSTVGGPQYEIVILDNGSTDGTESWGRLFGEDNKVTKYVRYDQPLGFGGACNAGAREAKGDMLVFLNNDTVVNPGWLESMTNTFVKRQDAGIVAPLIVLRDKFDPAGNGALIHERTPRPPRDFRIPMASGCCFMIRRDLFLGEIGGFDPRYGIGYFEDDHLNMEVKARGLSVYVSVGAEIVHDVRQTMKSLDPKVMSDLFHRNKKIFEEHWRVAWRPSGEHVSWDSLGGV